MSAPLLPAGLHDLLPPEAAKRFTALQGFIGACQSFGYHFVAPPLVEFADTESALLGETPSPRFQLMDPLSQRIIGVRGDITPQVARLASTRLGHWPRPLRLCYAGAILRPQHTQWRPEREFFQVGFELIGLDAPAGELEVMRLALYALQAIGMTNLTLDIGYPSLTQRLCQYHSLPSALAQRLQQRLPKKDGEVLAQLPLPAQADFQKLLSITLAREVDAALAEGGMCPPLREALTHISRLIGSLAALMPAVRLHLDLTEQQGFHFQHGLCFAVYADAIKGEIGRGGRYTIAGTKPEPATGFSLYLDTLLRVLPTLAEKPVIRVLTTTATTTLEALIAQGYTVQFHADAATLADKTGAYYCPNQQKVVEPHG